MAEESPATVSTESPTTPKKEKKVLNRPKTSHPSTADMVNTAIENLKERGGSSLQAIKKYMSSTFKIDSEKYAPFIRKYIKSAVTSGVLVQTKGKGASGSFKLASSAVSKSVKTTEAKSKKPAAAKRAAKSKAKPAAEKEKSVSPQKSPVKKATRGRKPAVATSPKKTVSSKAAKAKSPSKAKKTAKSPTKKPKSPKPKTTKAKAPANSPKKTSQRKK